MKVLVACEYSATVRDAFIAKGHDAVSCDILPTESEGPHYQGDVYDILDEGWDLMVAHPPCTYLAVSGNKWLYHPDDKHLPVEQRRPHPKHPNRKELMEDAAKFFIGLYNSNISKVAIENPVSRISSMFRKPDQTFHPYQFGADAEKRTCLWLKGLPPLKHTDVIEPTYHYTNKGTKYSKWWWDTCSLQGKARQHARSKTFQGVADAMADQWG